jgi:hypothetical protein
METVTVACGVEIVEKAPASRIHRDHACLLLFWTLGVSLLGGCATSKEAQLKKVAKDWCLTIRASQVIPVYPLSEDLQPGDIFLVQVPIDKQQKVYEEQGFLPLDNHLARLDPSGYEQFYDRSFIATNNVPLLPRDWIRPPSRLGGSWQPAPHVAFPTYSFSVRRGAGLNLAVPVQGVPVGLSLLGSDAADGSVSIKHAQTLGVDTLSLYRQVQEWAQANADFLRYFGSSDDESKKNYLRIVTRVFATGEMDVNLRASGSQSAGLDVGAPKPVDLLFPELPGQTNISETVQKNFTTGWETLQKLVSEAAMAARDATGNFLPGGSLRLTGASARTVSLMEEFDPPVILGYLGFDVVIHPGGVLGPPIPTHAILKPEYDFKRDLFQEPHSTIYSEAALRNIYHTLSNAPAGSSAAKAAATLDALTRFVPETFVAYDISNNNPPAIAATKLSKAELLGGPPNYLSYAAFRTRLAQSIRALEFAMKFGSFNLVQDGRERDVQPGSELYRQLQARHEDYIRQRDDVSANNAARRAGVAATIQYLEFISQ